MALDKGNTDDDTMQGLFIDSILGGTTGPQDDAQFIQPDGNLKRVGGIDGDPSMRKRITSRRQLTIIRETHAARQIGSLPEPGEEVLMILTGLWHGTDLVGAINRIDPAVRFADVTMATMSMNRQNADYLATLMEAEIIQRLLLVVSTAFINQNADEYHGVLAALAPHNARIGAQRNHAKTMTFLTTDGRKFYVHGSLNLRRCQAYEQMAFGQDAGTHDFLRQFTHDIADPVVEKPK